MDKVQNIKDRLIFALDVEDKDKAIKLIDELGDHVTFYKLGLEVMMAGIFHELTEYLRSKDKKVFADMKMFDITATVCRAVEQANERGVTFASLHHNNDVMLQEANRVKGDLKILVVTVLTSLTNSDLESQGFDVDKFNVQNLVLSRAENAFKSGCDGVVSSGLEAPALRDKLGKELIIVTPGIRPVANVDDDADIDYKVITDDQKRVVHVKQAFENGADYIVVGRPIRDSNSPAKVADYIQSIIYKHFNV